MNCTDINTYSDDYLDGRLTVQLQRDFEQHLSECRHCMEYTHGMKLILTDLRQLPVPMPSADLEKRVFNKVRKQYAKKPSSHFVAGFTTALAAGLALWVVSVLFIVEQSTITPANEMTLVMNASQTIRLLFDAPSDIDQVTLSIDLPGNFEINGYPGCSELTWQTSLSKGENVLALPIMAVDKGTGELIAQLSYGDKIKVFRLILNTAEDGAMNTVIQPLVPA